MRHGQYRKYGVALAVIMLTVSSAFIVSGCGGAAITAGTLLTAQHDQGKQDNPLIPVPPGHPNRIAFLSNMTQNNGNIFTIDSGGGGLWMITETPKAASRTFVFTSPAMTQEGLDVYYAVDWYATSTDIMSCKIDGVSPSVVVRHPDNIETPRLSWDGTKIAFAGYKLRTMTLPINPNKAFVTADEKENPDQNAHIGIRGAAEWMYSKSTGSETATPGICNKACVSCVYDPSMEDPYDDFNDNIKFVTSYGNDLKPADNPTGKTFCIKIDPSNTVEITITDYFYSQNMDTTKEPGHVTFTWEWLEGGYDGGSVTMTGEMDGTVRVGVGYDFIHTFDFRQYDIYTADIDGTNLIQHTDDDDPDRFPCFSPASNDYIYFTHGTINTTYMEYDEPDDSYLYELTIATSATEQITSGTLDRHCSVNPSGGALVYSHYNGSDYDLYQYDIAGDTSTLLVDTGGDDLYPVYSPAGGHVAFQSDLTIDNDIFKIAVDGTGLTNLTNNYAKEEIMPAWAP